MKSISYSVYYCFDFKIKTKMTVKEKLSTFDFHAFYYFTKIVKTFVKNNKQMSFLQGLVTD